jgi:putative membrane protein
METSNLPLINAIFNSLSTLCLISGYIFIKFKKDEKNHKRCMFMALFFSTIFLIGYLIYHYNHGSTIFPELGWIKTLYLTILFPHIILAVVMVPMILITFKHALTGNFVKHKKIARLTFPIWMYVSITGVIIYMMVYQWFRV